MLEYIAIYMELKGENSFKIAAFRKAANALEIDDLTTLAGIGKGTATVIEEYRETGRSSVLKQLQDEVPSGLIALLQLPGLGGKKIAKLYKDLGIENVTDLESACREGKVRVLAGFGKKTEE